MKVRSNDILFTEIIIYNIVCFFNAFLTGNLVIKQCLPMNENYKVNISLK